jgi:hypothetical protein
MVLYGDVGIEKTPAEKLDVNGIIKATGYKSSDGTAGMSDTIIFEERDGTRNTVTIKDGLITAWSKAH